MASTAKPLRADARRNRERIIEAARDVFARSGLDAQMDEVAAEAGVGVGTVYRHFPTKHALVSELFRARFTAFTANARVAAARTDVPAFDALADLLRANASICAADASTQQLMGSVDDRVWEEIRDVHDELDRLAEGLIARAREEGSVRPDLAVADIPMLMCGVSSSMRRGDAAWRRHLEIVIDGLRAR